jgi:hypothetical protein
MTLRPSTAERLDRALDQLLSGVPPRAAAASAGLPAAQHALLDAASSLRAALAASVVAPGFEARLGARLSGAGGSPWILRHPGRLIVGGAVGSAVGVGVTAYAVWRTTRRAGAAHRLLHW